MFVAALFEGWGRLRIIVEGGPVISTYFDARVATYQLSPQLLGSIELYYWLGLAAALSGEIQTPVSRRLSGPLLISFLQGLFNFTPEGAVHIERVAQEEHGRHAELEQTGG